MKNENYEKVKEIVIKRKKFCLLILAEREASGSGVGRVSAPPPSQDSSVDMDDEVETDDAGSTNGKAASPVNPLLQEYSNCEELRHVICHLETKELWDKFNELGTEMIITKTGRWVNASIPRSIRKIEKESAGSLPRTHRNHPRSAVKSDRGIP